MLRVIAGTSFVLKEDLDLELDFERNPFGLDVPPRTVDVDIDVDVDVDFDVGVVAVNRSSADKQSSGIIVLIVLV